MDASKLAYEKELYKNNIIEPWQMDLAVGCSVLFANWHDDTLILGGVIGESPNPKRPGEASLLRVVDFAGEQQRLYTIWRGSVLASASITLPYLTQLSAAEHATPFKGCSEFVLQALQTEAMTVRKDVIENLHNCLADQYAKHCEDQLPEMLMQFLDDSPKNCFNA